MPLYDICNIIEHVIEHLSIYLDNPVDHGNSRKHETVIVNLIAVITDYQGKLAKEDFSVLRTSPLVLII